VPKRKRISDAEARVLVVAQLEGSITKGAGSGNVFAEMQVVKRTAKSREIDTNGDMVTVSPFVA
jgi:hypothetical protein